MTCPSPVPSPPSLDTVRHQVCAIVDELTALRFRLIGVQASLPPSPEETSEADLDREPDLPTDLRAVLANGLLNCLDPLIRDFREACRRIGS
jgi:hypothetical protein